MWQQAASEASHDVPKPDDPLHNPENSSGFWVSPLSIPTKTSKRSIQEPPQLTPWDILEQQLLRSSALFTRAPTLDRTTQHKMGGCVGMDRGSWQGLPGHRLKACIYKLQRGSWYGLWITCMEVKTRACRASAGRGACRHVSGAQAWIHWAWPCIARTTRIL